MEAYFNEVAALLDRSLADGEMYTLKFDAEASDFVRLNRGKVRQSGTVGQRYLQLHLIAGLRHAEHRLAVSGDLAQDRALIVAALRSLRDALADVLDDPHLMISQVVQSSRVLRESRQPPTQAAIATVLEAAQGLDLVGFYAAGPVFRGFANSLGQRNWHQVTSFHFEWSLYHHADKAVKTVYSGFDWSDEELARRMNVARERLSLLAAPPRSLEPGAYRAYLAPSAMEEIANMLCWGGFSGRALKTRQSCLFRMEEGAAAFDPSVQFSENTRDGVAPAFQDEGFTRPDRVGLIENGRLVGSLVSPRTAREFSLAANGANPQEVPESLDMGAGSLRADDALTALDRGLYIGNLWYLNFSDRPACRLTGMTRFASFWVDKGRIVAPVNVMRFDDSVFRMFGDHLVGLTAERDLIVNGSTYGSRNVNSMRLPGAVVSDMTFTL